MGVAGQSYTPADSTPGKTRYPFYRRLGGPQGWSGRAENLVPTGISFNYNLIDPSVHKYNGCMKISQ